MVGYGVTSKRVRGLLVSDFAAFVWENGKMANLNKLLFDTGGFTQLEIATGINDTGEIVGQGIINDQRHAYIALPLP